MVLKSRNNLSFLLPVIVLIKPQMVSMYNLNPDIVLNLAGLTFYALFARMLIKFHDKYSRNLLYFLLANIVSVGFTVVFVLIDIKQAAEPNYAYLGDILDVSWAFSLVTGSFCFYFAP